MKNCFILFFVVCCMVFAGCMSGSVPDSSKTGDKLESADVPSTKLSREMLAREAAERWLKLVDEGKYDQSWHQSSEYFKANISIGRWMEMLGGIRTPLGDVVKRVYGSGKYYTELPGVPDGEYFVIQYKTGFSGKKSAKETVTPMKEKDGSWRVSGYFIK